MQDFNINDTLLGKTVDAPAQYDASVLFRIPRSENRTQYGISESSLPFVGFDVWNCYELSFLTNNGLPVCRMLKLIYTSSSTYLVESKSLKLYLNSFNMCSFGDSISESEINVKAIIERDLSKILETLVCVNLFDSHSKTAEPFSTFKKNELVEMISSEELSLIQFSHFTEKPDLLEGVLTSESQTLKFHTDTLRSNCRVTNQPDWGDLFVEMVSNYKVNLSTVLEYIVSFRKENHFHEEVVEMIFMRLLEKFEPQQLMVAALYTRRGGIDINPIRATHHELIDKVLVSNNYRAEKTMRQ